MVAPGRVRQHLIVVVAILIPVIIFLLGCAGDDRSNDRKVKIVWTIGGGDSRPTYLSIINEFEQKYPHIQVQPLQITGNYYQKLTVMLAGRTPPDLFWMGEGFGEFAARGAFLDLSDRIVAEIDTREYHPKVLSWYRVGAMQYGIPTAIDIQFIVYNKKAFDDVGLAYPNDGWTIDEFVRAAKRLTVDRDGDGSIDQYGFRGQMPAAMWGAQFVADDGNEAWCDRPEMIEWAHFYLDMLYKWKVAPTPEQIRSEGLSDRYLVFRQGKVAMLEAYTFLIGQFRERCADVDWDIVTYPVVKHPAHWASSQAYLIAADTKHPDEAWLLFKHVLSDRMSANAFPANLKVAKKLVAETTLKPANMGCLLSASDHLYPNPRIPNLQELLSIWNNATERVFSAYGTSRQISPREAFTEAARRINETIAKRKRH